SSPSRWVNITGILGQHHRNLHFYNFETDTKCIVMGGQVINIDREILGGATVFYGTRVPIKNLFDYLETGDSIETFLDDFEGVSKDQVIRLLEMLQKLIETSQTYLII
ncbi:MAG: DUF433 domain-containing protein, partial [Rhabdochlamydiaceae bacterium]